jgi:hypothetical protein
MRKRVFGAALAVCALVPVAIAAQQTVRFNDAVALDHDEPPLVSVWIEGGTAFRFGQPIRVHYRVEEDAYVVVARVDWDGNLTTAFRSGKSPGSRNRSRPLRSVFPTAEYAPLRGYPTFTFGMGFPESSLDA